MTQFQKLQQTPEWIERLRSDLRSQGYASVLDTGFSDGEADSVIGQLLPEFKYLLYVEADQRKKYFIADYAGRNTVIKLLDRLRDHKKTTRMQLQAQDRLSFARYSEEIDRLHQLEKMLLQERFG
ncbi:hypothetical protein [Paenibacillus campi]|uniref:hypothetical protein n=1 Tax=Paenibacillus campi TaxID=3106031 RepID=UPI002AFEC086|nr:MULTISPECIES: hypothetical protein [unclassified Paenibacillus]